MTDEERILAENAFSKEFNHTLHAYIDMTGDLVAGTLLDQIIFWFTPDKNGNRKVRVIKDDVYWLAKTRYDWYDEIRISPKQYDRASKILQDKGFIETKIFKFDNKTVVHIRPIFENIHKAEEEWKEKRVANPVNTPDLPKGKIQNSLKGNSKIDQEGIPITEDTTLVTKERTNLANMGGFSEKAVQEQVQCDRTYTGWGDIVNEKVKRSKWQWGSHQQYRDYINKMMPRYLKNILKRKNREDDLTFCIDFFRYFFESYRLMFGKYHPWYKEKTLESVIDDMDLYFGEGCYDYKDAERYVDEFFSKGSLSGYEMKVFSNTEMLRYVQSVADNEFVNINSYY